MRNVMILRQRPLTICQAMYAILVERKPLEDVVQSLLGRAKRAEHDAYEV